MADKVVRIPINSKQRSINEHGQGYVPCEVSSRWLQFPDQSTLLNCGELMFVDVMTYDSNDNPKKICNLCISREDIMRALNNVKPKPE